ncbi:ATPase family AAA domain-containing protein 5 isoform X2 [Peromyscus californicus insignis]|uniref:ATPase family AAA domain-containing protein 5 isoform X2 n=1 Tax=Peromyscus californicus insignis TaxID=564181 RepID=UPI0022A6A3DE|nr:ATPase family AAA domain-containing protein 5 isoform X2 [Peromyscus californicus insignis]
MVGVLTMAAAAAPPPVKDYEIEPCKKRRKDDDSSSCETITKYLSPVGKTGDRVFSPPKPSKILHYFRKTSPTNEKSTKECKIKPSPSSLFGNSKDCKTPLEVLSNVEVKKKGKRINLSHQLNDIKIESSVGISGDRKEECGLSDFVESSTDVFLYKKHVEVLTESLQDSRNKPNTMTPPKKSRKVNPKQDTTKNDGKMLRKRKHSKLLELSESLPLADEISLLKKGGKDSKQTKPSVADENERTANHVDPRACATKVADLNKSTITVSYEEFLKSHKAARVEEMPDHAVPACVPPGPGEAVKSGSEGELESCELSPHIHLKTVTVLAQVHPTPPKKKGKIPPMFLKQKQLDLESSLSDPENEQTVQKRKSNVVIQEGQLELAVLEAGSSEASVPKCSVEERQQFMRAFRQPLSEMLKTGLKKPLEKQKDPSEKSVSEDGDNSSEKIIENPNIQIVSNHGSSQTHTDKASFPKEKSKKSRKKDRKTIGTRTTPGGNREETMQKEKTSFSPKNKPKQNSLRRSLRQKSEVSKSKSLLNSESLVCEDTAHNSLEMSPCDRNKSRKHSTPIKDMVTHSKAEPENRLQNISTPKPTRRSLRGSNTPATVTLRGTESEDAQDTTSPVKPSTPKAASISEKHSLYTAELITVPSDSESPIRMKFTRISTPKKSKKKSKKMSKKSETTEGDLTSQKRKANSTSKNVSKAKQLIEKAKAFRVSGSKAEETVVPLRRSSRHQTLPEREKSPETDDSVILIDSSPTSVKQPEKNQKKLKNLNDVLGKKLNKPSKNVPGKMKIAPLFLAKKTKRTAIPVLDLDESSQDSSEQTQDCDVQFRAKRDFLRSGLPDLLKRQIAKKAAALDVYNAVSTSFQRVVHVQQKDDEYWLWHLKPPSCPLLTEFKELNTKVTDLSKCVVALGEFSTLNSNPRSNSAVVLMRTRKDFTKEVRNLLLEEITQSNPEFSLGKYFPLLLKKRIEHQVLSEGHGKQASPQLQPRVSQKETKRKCVETGNHRSKRKKPNEYSMSPEEIKEKSEDLEKRINSSGINLHSAKDSGTEDMLWTEKYQPQNSNELIGNELAIKKLYSWLKDWKRRAELEERQNSKAKRDEKQEDLSDSMDFKGSSDDEECHLCNTVLITGPTGVGKTAAVYACAQELGFKIFEVNASSQRSGRQILSQLKEATQSHQVDKQGVNSQKPCFFNNYNIGKSPKKLNSPGKVVISPRKLPPSSPKGSGQKRALPPKTLANYFKVSSKSKNNEEVGALMGNNKGIKNSSLEQRHIIQTKSTNANNSNAKEIGAEESNRKKATSLILFEEVDVIFDEDTGFLNAVKTFMATTKRPVVLTTSDPTFSLVFDGCFEEINFNIPSLLNVASYLQVICLVENFRTDLKDFVTLLTANACDIRKSILYLQFWIRSGGGILEERPLSHCRGNSRSVLVCSDDSTDAKINSKNSRRNRVALPKCDTGCAEALFGLKNIASPSQDLFSLLKHKVTTKEEWHKFIQLLTEFHMQNIDLLYSNLEFILPLPVTVIPEVKDAYGSPVTTEASAPGSMEHLPRKQSEDQPLKKSQKRKQRKMVTLDDSDLFDTGLDFSDDLTGLSPVPSSALEDITSRDREGNPETQTQTKSFTSDSVPQPPKTPAEKKCSVLVSHCLNSLIEFMENMSFLDALLPDPGEQNELSKNPFHWTSGKVKSGLCDEFSIESRDGWAPQSSEELKATAEALSFTKCSSTISKALESLNPCKHLGRDLVNGLTFCVPQRSSDVCFRQSAANLDNADKRMAVIKSVFSSRSFLNVGNKQASILDYLPTLRNICRTEKLKEQGKNKRRFLHYFEGIHLDIPEEAVTALAADFP